MDPLGLTLRIGDLSRDGLPFALLSEEVTGRVWTSRHLPDAQSLNKVKELRV